MKKSYYRNLFLYQLDTRNPVDVFKASLNKINDIEILNEVVKRLHFQDLDGFIDILSQTTYDLNKSSVNTIVYRFVLNNSLYKKFMALKIFNFSECPINGLLNFCLYFNKASNNAKFQKLQQYSNELDKLVASLPVHASGLSKSDSFAVQEYYKILNEQYFLNSDGLSEEMKNNTKDTLLRAIIDKNRRVNGQEYPIKDLLLVDLKQIYSLDDEKKAMMKLCIISSENRVCQCCGHLTAWNSSPNTSIHNGNVISSLSNINLNNTGNTNTLNDSVSDIDGLNNIPNSNRNGFNTTEFKKQINSLLDDYIIEGNVSKVCQILSHCEFLRLSKYFKILLKFLISSKERNSNTDKENVGINTVGKEPIGLQSNKIQYPVGNQGNRIQAGMSSRENDPRTNPNGKIVENSALFKPLPNCIDNHDDSKKIEAQRIINAIDSFSMDEEIETLTISFLKASSGYFQKAISAIPVLIKTRKTCFASFVVLLQAYSKSSSLYMKSITKNLIFRFNDQFSSVIDLISVFIFKINTEDTVPVCDESLLDKEFLGDKLAVVAEMFSAAPEQFIQRHIYTVFNSLYPHKNFTQSFIDKNIKYLVVQRILEGNYEEQVNDVDILIGVLFQDHFRGLDALYKPTVAWFIKKNLSHILFKIKNAYVLKLYNRKCCIYKVLKFIMTGIKISLYFNYIWSYVEFFLNKEFCICSGYFVEWLRNSYDSRLMSPYLLNPFEKIEDIPILTNVESKVYPMLARYLFDDKKIQYDSCPYELVNKGGIYSSTSKRMKCSSASTSSSICSINKLSPIYPKTNTASMHSTVSISSMHTADNTQLLHPTGMSSSSCLRNIESLYLRFKENIPTYSPNSIVPDQDFIEKFIYHIKSNKIFKSKILQLYPNLPIETKALFGSLKYDYRVDSTPKAPENIAKAILERFLLKIDYEKQDLFAFTIQEFLKVISEPFDPEIESFIEQFRHTKLEYKFKVSAVTSISFESYRPFLESLFYILYGYTTNINHFKYLVLFEDNVLEYACLCLIKLCYNHNLNEVLVKLFNNIGTHNKEILKFLLKINVFTASTIITNKDFLNYALNAKDFYSVIYCLESEETNLDLLQIAYYMVDDAVRVKGFNSIGRIMTNSYGSMNLFFDFVLDKNYKAARECFKGISKEAVPSGTQIENIAYNPDRSVSLDMNARIEDSVRMNSNAESDAATMQVFELLRAIIEKNTEEEIDSFIVSEEFYCSNPILLHVLKDLELLKDCKDIERTIELINERREISTNPDSILKIHKLFAMKIDLEPFSKSIDFEIIKLLRKRKEFQKCEEEIARMVLKGEFGVLYEHALVKIDQKHLSEAKDLLKRLALISQSNLSYIEYFKATVKLCEISKISNLFENSIAVLEDIFFKDTYFQYNENGAVNASQYSNDNIAHNYNTFSQVNAKYGHPANAVDNRTIADGIAEIKHTANVANDKYAPSVADQMDIIGLPNNKQSRSMKNGKRNVSTNQQELNKLKNMYDKLKKINQFPYKSNRSQSSYIEAYNYLQKLYFLTAKHFEKTDILLSIKYYFKSFTSNHEAIPRFFHHIADIPKTSQKQVGEMVEIIVKEHLANLIPFYTQISTKLSFSNDQFYKTVISALLEKYPYQTFWNTLILANSKRIEVKEKTLKLIENLSFENRLIFKNILRFSERLTNIAKSTLKKLSMQDFPEIREMLPCKINIPGQMTEINRVKDEIRAFVSLQSPKKIILVGEDGKEYHIIVKYKDDLRKIGRFMDLDNLLNELFDDGYYIRKYNVIPFTHDSGIIEYVPNLYNLKEVILKYYSNINESVYKYTKYKKVGGNNMEMLCNQFKPIYNRYLKSTYNDPYQFYTVRENYIKTYAIMNIVGWFMGLGDRHTENIHFDMNTGDTVHVDLNCIFDKAKTLEIPEKVPFRLTQNIVDGFGKLGVEGTYIHTMKYTLRLLKDNRDVIQANLLSFVFDPLFEWAKKKTEPSKIIEGMNKKLDFEDEDEKIDELIDEATDINNLGSMYIGWLSFI